MIILELDASLSYEGLLVPLLLLDGLLGAALVLHQPLLDLVEPDVHLAVGGVDGGRQPHVLRLKCPQSEKFRSVTTQKFKLNTVKFTSVLTAPCHPGLFQVNWQKLDIESAYTSSTKIPSCPILRLIFR